MLALVLCLLFEITPAPGSRGGRPRRNEREPWGDGTEQQELLAYWTAARRSILGDPQLIERIAMFDLRRLPELPLPHALSVLRKLEKPRAMYALKAEFSSTSSSSGPARCSRSRRRMPSQCGRSSRLRVR